MFRGIDIGMKALLTVITAWATSNFRYFASRCVAIGLTYDGKQIIYPNYRNSITNHNSSSSFAKLFEPLSALPQWILQQNIVEQSRGKEMQLVRSIFEKVRKAR